MPLFILNNPSYFKPALAGVSFTMLAFFDQRLHGMWDIPCCTVSHSLGLTCDSRANFDSRNNYTEVKIFNSVSYKDLDQYVNWLHIPEKHY